MTPLGVLRGRFQVVVALSEPPLNTSTPPPPPEISSDLKNIKSSERWDPQLFLRRRNVPQTICKPHNKYLVLCEYRYTRPKFGVSLNRRRLKIAKFGISLNQRRLKMACNYRDFRGRYSWCIKLPYLVFFFFFFPLFFVRYLVLGNIHGD